MKKYHFPPFFSFPPAMDDGNCHGGMFCQSQFFLPKKSSSISDSNKLETDFDFIVLEDCLEDVYLSPTASPKCRRTYQG